MKKLLLAICLINAANLSAQMINNVPESGPVTIGTDTPIYGKQLTVSGNVSLHNSIDIEENLLVDGQSKLNGVVRMEGIDNYSGDTENLSVVITDSTGNVTKMAKSVFLSALMQPLDYCGEGAVASPSWFNGTNKLFSPCPQVKVGIGTANPNFNLDVKGEAFALKLLIGNALGVDSALVSAYALNHSQQLFRLGKKIGALDEEIRFTVNNDGTTTITTTGDAAALTIQNGGGHAIVVKDATGNKIAQLQNDGLLRTRSVRVDLVSWADYVFEADYKLMSLANLKKYIKSYHHLPNIPPAESIARHGLDVGKMQTLQMEKIEELTLHLIEMDERMQAMDKRMQQLEAENATLINTNK